jgi:pimeloyl-ACP methyl ester carboxylesterase
VLDTLSRDRPVIVFDNRGCGRTQPHDVTNSMALLADDCLGLAEHLGLHPSRPTKVLRPSGHLPTIPPSY